MSDSCSSQLNRRRLSRLASKRFNSGKIEALMALYAPEAV